MLFLPLFLLSGKKLFLLHGRKPASQRDTERDTRRNPVKRSDPLNIAVGLVVACTIYAFYAMFRKGGF